MGRSMADLSVSLLGPFAASLDGQPLTHFRTRSVQALLIYLVCESERPHQREVLMDLLWPGMPLTSAQANMRQTLYRLRRIIPEVKGNDGGVPVPFLLTNRQTIQINPDAAYVVDIDAFADLVEIEPAQAIEFYRGDFLVDFYLPDSEVFEEWAAARRAYFRRQVLSAAESITSIHLQKGDFEAAERLARQQLTIDNLRESSHRQLLEALAGSGSRQEALTHYNDLRQLLRDELGIEPQRETLELIEAIRSGDLAAARPTVPRRNVWLTNQTEKASHNLPQLLTSFVGREKEMAAVGELIKSNRLVMLTGSGGIGKTILCLEAGRHLLESFPGGVWLVELAPVADPELLRQTTADALGLRESPDQPISDVLLDYLRERNCLLILDNCEHLIDAVAKLVVALLQACPDLKILASSREALGVPGEVPYRVPPLAVPDVSEKVYYEAWNQYDALRLFVERAITVMPGFQVTEDNLPALVQICRRLDGLPLALELAAARINVLTTSQIAARLDDRFRLLTGGSRTALPRQQTLRALIDWSWDLLDEAEKLLLCRLSVFAGSMSLEAVEAVCAGDRLDAHDLLDLMSELINKSLVIPKREQGQETRYRLLETIRQYAQEQLLITGQIEKYRNHHLDYYLRFAEKVGPQLVRSGQAVLFKQLEIESDNHRAAQIWARETNVEAGLRLLIALWRFWAFNYAREGEHWLAKMLANSDDVALRIKADALLVQAELNLGLADLDRAHALAQKSLAIYREINDEHGIALSIGRLGWATLWTGEHGKGRELLLESLGLLRAMGDKLGTADMLSGLGFHEWKYDYEQGIAYLTESEALYRELGHLAGILTVQDSFAQLAIWRGDYDTAKHMLEAAMDSREALGLKEEAYVSQLYGDLCFRQENYQQARDLFLRSASLSKEAGHYFTYNWAVIRLGHVSLRLGEFNQAQEYLEKSLRLFDEMGSVDGIIFAIEGFASLAQSQDQPKQAAILYAWADATRTANQDPRPPVEQVDVDRDTAVAIGLIGLDDYDKAYNTGQAMRVEQAVESALQLKIQKAGM